MPAPGAGALHRGKSTNPPETRTPWRPGRIVPTRGRPERLRRTPTGLHDGSLVVASRNPHHGSRRNPVWEFLLQWASSQSVSIRRTNAVGVEFWSSRDFAQVLGYADFGNFEQVIQKARTVCFNSANRIEDHFVEITEMVEIGKGGQRALSSFWLLASSAASRFQVNLSENGLPPTRWGGSSLSI